MDAALGCPVFGRKLIDSSEDDPTGNMCLVEQLLPCRLACLPYKQHGSRNQVVILSSMCLMLAQGYRCKNNFAWMLHGRQLEEGYYLEFTSVHDCIYVFLAKCQAWYSTSTPASH